MPLRMEPFCRLICLLLLGVTTAKAHFGPYGNRRYPLNFLHQQERRFMDERWLQDTSGSGLYPDTDLPGSGARQPTDRLVPIQHKSNRILPRPTIGPGSRPTTLTTTPSIDGSDAGEVSFNLTWRTSFPEFLKRYRVEYRSPVSNTSVTSERLQFNPVWSVAATLPSLSRGYTLKLPKGPEYQVRVFGTLQENGKDFLILDTSENGQRQCDDRWENRQQSCYRMFSGIMPWTQAVKRCEREGAHLVDIDSHEENTFVLKVVRKNLPPKSWVAFWIGLNDRKQEGNFVWMNGASLKPRGLFQGAWNAGEPNNAKASLEGEDCVEMFKVSRTRTTRRGVWNDLVCTKRVPGYICEQRLEDGQVQNQNVITQSTTPPPTTQASRRQKYTIHWIAPFPLQSFSVEHRLLINPDRHRFYGPWIIDAEALPSHTISYTAELDGATYEFRINGTLMGVSMPLELVRQTLHASDTATVQPDAIADVHSSTDSQADQNSPCERFWRRYNGSCYRRFSSSGVTWFQANRGCERKGAKLVSITSEEENEFVSSLLGRRPPGRSWIGLSDRKKEGQFVWMNGDSLIPEEAEFPYNNWHKGEPNNLGKHKEEDCAAMWSGGSWNDFHCHQTSRNSYVKGYVCEKEANVVHLLSAENTNIRLYEPKSFHHVEGLYDDGELTNDLLVEYYDTDGKFRHYGLVENVTYPVNMTLYSSNTFYQIHQLVRTHDGMNFTLASSLFRSSHQQHPTSSKGQGPVLLRGIIADAVASDKTFTMQLYLPVNITRLFHKRNERAIWEIRYRQLGTANAERVIAPLSMQPWFDIENLPVGNYEVQVVVKSLDTDLESSTFTTIVSGLCPPQWTWQNGKCYFIHHRLRWSTAKLICELKEGELSQKFDRETKAMLSRLAAAGLGGTKVRAVWVDGKPEDGVCSTMVVSSGVVVNRSCEQAHPFMCEKDDLSPLTNHIPGSQTVSINRPVVQTPSYWPQITSHSLVIEKFDTEQNRFQMYKTVDDIDYPYNIRLEPGFYQLSHIAIAKSIAGPDVKCTVMRLPLGVQFTGERPFEVTGVKLLRQSERSTAAAGLQRPLVVWTVELPLLPEKCASMYSHWRIVYSGKDMTHNHLRQWKNYRLVPVFSNKVQTINLQAVPDYGMAVEVTAIGNSGQESTTFTKIVG